MATLKAQEGKWLYNGSVFAKEVSTYGDTSNWTEVTDSEKQTKEALKAEEVTTELTIAERLDALEKKYTELYNSIGKLVQTKDGDGTAFNPFKTWMKGTEVHSGEWWQTEDGYLWEAIKDGVPSSSTDKEYWDIVE